MMNTSTPHERSSHLGIWIFASVVVIGLVVSFVAYRGSVSTSSTAKSANNSAALQQCIAQNVEPLQHLAAIAPANQAAAEAQNAQVALDSCKAQYPTN